MYSIHIGDSRPVISIFIVSMDLEVWLSRFIAGFGHQITAVAHEVVLVFIKGGVVGITRRCACGCTYLNNILNTVFQQEFEEI